MSIGTDNRILVWDAPVRVFHWLMVLCFAGAYLTAESERWRLIHVTLGYTMGGLIVFRLLWGVAGTRYTRFANFVRGPSAIVGYLRTLPGDTPTHYTGHNPAGAVAIVLLLVAGCIIVATGWASYNEFGGEWLSELHEGASNTMLAIVAIHVVGVVVSSRLHRENLVRSMVTGSKAGARIDSIESALWMVALLLLAAVLVFWWFQWQGAPVLVPA